MRDKDPFANAEAKPKDNISAMGFIWRAAVRYLRAFIIFYLIAAVGYYLIFGETPSLGF
tara:strand:- start:1463 stop:1639 length:177 start_codon:yes stop_codon:yes gene_type:complete